MENINSNSLQTEDEINQTSSFKKKQILNDRKRGEIRRNIEEIKERKRLKELLGDDYDDFDYLDS